MPQVHTVAQGEHLGSIATAYGFVSYDPIWNHSQNQELRKLRSDPMVLYPGDQVFIPDVQVKSLQCATEQRHTIVVKGGKLKIRLRLLDSLGEPLANEECEVSVGARKEAIQTDGDGKVEFFVRPTDRIATIVAEGLTFKAAIGHLDPPDTASGVASRVGNLGHAYADPTDLEIVDEPRYFALALFLDEEGFDPNAKSFAAFNDRLRQKHGV